MKTFLFKTPMVVLLFISFLTYGQKQQDTDKTFDNNPVYLVTYDAAYQGNLEPNKNTIEYASDFAAAIFMPFVNEIAQSKSEVLKIQPSKNYYGYRFEDYPASYNKDSKKAPFNSKKSKVKINDIKTVISDYNKNSVNFGGHYQLYDMEKVMTVDDVDEGIGAWIETSTIIIDTKTGIAYSTPFPGLGDEYCETGYSKKYFENTQFLYKKNSNLLITHDCQVDENLNDIFIIKLLYKISIIRNKEGTQE